MDDDFLFPLTIGVLVYLGVLFFLNAGESEPEYVPVCDPYRYGHTFYAQTDTNEASIATMNLLSERGWIDIHRVEHFWVDEITAYCPDPSWIPGESP